jgi:hypothetical protein
MVYTGIEWSEKALDLQASRGIRREASTASVRPENDVYGVSTVPLLLTPRLPKGPVDKLCETQRKHRMHSEYCVDETVREGTLARVRRQSDHA